MKRSLLGVIAWLLLSACAHACTGTETGNPDPADRRDAGDHRDGGASFDSGMPPPLDGGQPPPQDAGTTNDAGAGSDAGGGSDAGLDEDGNVPDPDADAGA